MNPRRQEREVGCGVVARPGEPPEKLIRRFVKVVRADGILQELFLRRFYEKPSVRRKRKRSRAEFRKRAQAAQKSSKAAKKSGRSI